MKSVIITHSTKRFMNATDGISAVIKHHLDQMALNLFEKRTAHLKTNIDNENGALGIVIRADKFEYHFYGFSEKLSQQLNAAMNA